MTKTRIAWIDNVKGFGILMIMLAHVIQNFPEFNPLNTYICSFHVPIFFVISGYVAAMAGREKMSSRRVAALLIPYAIFSCINTIVKFAVLGIQHALTVDIIKSELVELLITGNGTVWFLLTLLFAELLYLTTLRKISSIVIRKYICVLMIVLVFILPQAGHPLLVVLYRVICATGYYGLGALFKEAEEGKWAKVRKAFDKPLVAVALIVAGAAVQIAFGCGIDFFNGSFTKLIPSLLASLFSSFGWILIIRNAVQAVDSAKNVVDDNSMTDDTDMGKNTRKHGIDRILNYMGSNSIIVMLVHPIVLMVILYPFGNYIRSFTGVSAIIAGIVLYLVLCILQIPCVYIINKYLPFMIGRRNRHERSSCIESVPTKYQ